MRRLGPRAVDHVRRRSTVDSNSAAREAVERWRDNGEGGGGGALGVGSLVVLREGKEGWGRSGEERGCRGTLL
jgi:hypothetical protein